MAAKRYFPIHDGRHWYQVFHYYINKDKPGCDDAGVGAQRAVPFYRDGGGTARRAPTEIKIHPK